MNCKYCNKELDNKGNLLTHEKSCEKMQKIKDDVIKLYINDGLSVKNVAKILNTNQIRIIEILGDKKRNISEASIKAHKLYPEKFKHSDETKKILREKRLEYMKNNPEKTAWRLANMSYPEKLFLNKIKELEWDKKYLIIREKSVFPYFIDFAFENEKVAFEIDGSQHELEERKDSDDKKDKLLILNGWKIMRVPATNIKNNLDNVIIELEQFLISDIKYVKVGIIHKEEKKYYCECGNEKSKHSKNCKNCKENNKKVGIIYPKKYYKYVNKKKYYLNYCECGNEKGKYSKYCKKCSDINQRKIERPTLEKILEDVKELGYCGTGKKYGVSDNAIRKWIKKYNKNN